MTEYRGCKIRKSGKDFYRVIDPTDQHGFYQRVTSLDAAKAMIDATLESRVMTPAEHALVHPSYQR